MKGSRTRRPLSARGFAPAGRGRGDVGLGYVTWIASYFKHWAAAARRRRRHRPGGHWTNRRRAPFRDMSERKDQEYFGRTDRRTARSVGAGAGPAIPARTGHFISRATGDDRESRDPERANVLGGSVRKSATPCVSAELIRADNGYQLWAHTYDRDVKDVSKVQDEIAAVVAAKDCCPLRLH